MICALFALAAAKPVDESHAQEIQRSIDVRADGFSSKSETDNHITESRDGDEHGNIHGSFSYLTPEGETISISYVADENGYQPTGSVIPTSPPIPEAIVKSIEYNRAHARPEDPHH